MNQKLFLTPVQREILKRLSENKFYQEIATELDMDVEDVEHKVKSVFCLIGCEDISKQIVKLKVLGERLN